MDKDSKRRRKPKFHARYSGVRSKEFWNRIHAIKNHQIKRLLYGMGCTLQDAEARMLHALEESEVRRG